MKAQIKERVNQNNHGFAVGNLLFLNGPSYSKASAASSATAQVVGIVSKITSPNAFELTLLVGEMSGLSAANFDGETLPAAGSVIFLSINAGKLTTTEPSAVGQVSVQVGVMSSTTSIFFKPSREAVVGSANMQNSDGSPIYSGGTWTFKNAGGNSSLSYQANSLIFNVPDASDSFILWNSYDNPVAYIKSYNNNNNSSLSFATRHEDQNNETVRMFIDSNGALSSISNTDFTNYNSTNNGGNLFHNKSLNLGHFVCNFIKGANSTSTSNNFILFQMNDGNVNSGAIAANGANAAAFKTFSDSRMKKNIVPLQTELNKILTLNPVEFDYIEGGHQIGFIAQEMEQVYPDAINILGETEEMKTISGWDKTTARLVRAIQEQQVMIDALKAEVELLKNK